MLRAMSVALNSILGDRHLHYLLILKGLTGDALYCKHLAEQVVEDE